MREPLAKWIWWRHLANNIVLAEVPAGYDCFLVVAAAAAAAMRYAGDRVPIRMYLANYPLTPTMRSVEERFNVKYYLNLVITDVDDNKYFKQQVCVYISLHSRRACAKLNN